MGDLQCKHCGIERSYADAHIADIRGFKCDENVRKDTYTDPNGNQRTATLNLEHEWEEV